MNHKDLKKEIFKNRPDVEEDYKKKDIVFDISNMVTKARIKKGLTQTELAKKAGLKQPSIARIESGEHAPNLNTLNKLAKALDYELDINLKDMVLSKNHDKKTEMIISQDQRDKLKDFIQSRKYLVWYIKDFDSLSPESIVEHVLNYGDWSDIQELFDIVSINKVAQIFKKQTKNTNRLNYSPQILNYFNLYFKKHAKTS